MIPNLVTVELKDLIKQEIKEMEEYDYDDVVAVIKNRLIQELGTGIEILYITKYPKEETYNALVTWYSDDTEKTFEFLMEIVEPLQDMDNDYDVVKVGESLSEILSPFKVVFINPRKPEITDRYNLTDIEKKFVAIAIQGLAVRQKMPPNGLVGRIVEKLNLKEELEGSLKSFIDYSQEL